jgi:signal transduction histidine kinase
VAPDRACRAGGLDAIDISDTEGWDVRPGWKSLMQHTAVVAGSLSAALAVARLLPPIQEAPSPPFLAAVAVCAWRSGLVAGLLATVLSVAALDYFFLPPIYSFGVGLVDGVRLSAFVLVAALVSSLHASRRRFEITLRRQDRRRAEFLAMVAHELRNFLAPASNALQILRMRGGDEAPAERARGILERQVQNMTRLIDDLFDRARLDRGKLRLDLQMVDARDVVTRAADAVGSTARARGHRLEISLPDRLVLLSGDSTRLEQVFVNLLTNAIRYTDPGGDVQVEVEQTPREARIHVRDTGCGIAADRLPRIFDLFEQGSGEKERAGLGIGLSLVRDLVRLHGGEVKASSAGSGRGSEFTVCLPLATDERADARDEAIVPPAAISPRTEC